ncbi:translation factor Sua5, putative [Babesia bigemina]|uniref:Threonylcarbamoyl-AMP synthase n=1 Tax=Babesia bigemina TaxID=5866 RepID=A0A061DBE3_BABBI|nr:translation factor Sua5, putative [Babesia bigemina]CDR98021.1 translation factor Sua5, putative [Babesia bigemina]|eukprot:XP_012770207.1 translation factor Sua5, putative [Babesia bigemina]
MADSVAADRPTKLLLDDDPVPKLEMLKRHLMTPGGLIAMPTETVYGLAANGLCETSVRRIFEVKGRPLTDPVILHVPRFEDALCNIFDADLSDACMILTLAERFAPGPMTLITRGRTSIPSVVSANTGFPAVRCPNHPVAQMILRHVGVPLAAPSANKFGHISPTSTEHVLSEFNDVPMLVVEGGKCNLGLESTVIKVEPTDGDVRADEFLREHNATYAHLQAVISVIAQEPLKLQEMRDELVGRCAMSDGMPSSLPGALIDYLIAKSGLPRKVTILRPGFVTQADVAKLFASSVFGNVEVGCRAVYAKADELCDSPGTSLTHYAPSVPTYLVCKKQTSGGTCIDPQCIVMIDVGGVLREHYGQFLHYMPLVEGDETVARELYGSLREAERVALQFNGTGHQSGNHSNKANPTAVIVVNYPHGQTELSTTLRDRLVRASSGRTISYCLGSGTPQFHI